MGKSRQHFSFFFIFTEREEKWRDTREKEEKKKDTRRIDSRAIPEAQAGIPVLLDKWIRIRSRRRAYTQTHRHSAGLHCVPSRAHTDRYRSQ